MTAPETGRRLGALPIAALGAALLLLTAAAFRKIWGADFWWQYATGRLVAEHGIPREDAFSYTMAGRPWIELRWLYCWTLYHLHEALGASGVIVAKWLTLAASFGLVTATVVSRRTATLSAAVLTLAVLASGQRFFVRPELVTYLMVAGFLWIIDRYRRRGGRILFALPVLQVVWTNSHTLFIFGPLLAGLLAAVDVLPLCFGRRTRRETKELRRRAGTTLLAFGLTVLACLVNPWGLEGLAFPFQLFGEIRGSVFKESIGEFRSPFDFSQTYTAVAWYQALIAVCVASAALNVRRLDPFWTVLAASQLYLSTLAIRNVPLFALAAVPFVVHNVRSSELLHHRRVRPWMPRLGIAGALVVVAVGLGYSWNLATNRFNVRQHDTNQFGVGFAEHRFPDGAVRFLDEHGISGPVFHTMREGAFLLARGHRVFIDPRLEVYGEEHYARYIDTVSGAPGWASTLTRWGVTVVLLDPETPLVELLLASPEWALSHFDETSTVFTRAGRTSPPPLETRQDFERAVTRVRARLPEPLPRDRVGPFGRVRSPKPYLRVAELLIAVGQPELSLPFFRDARRATPDEPQAWRGEVWVHGYAGDRAAATELLEAALRRWPNDAWMLLQLGIHRFNGGRIDEAGDLVDRSLAADETSAAAWSLRARVHAARQDWAEAADAARAALRLDPSDPRYRQELDDYSSRALR